MQNLFPKDDDKASCSIGICLSFITVRPTACCFICMFFLSNLNDQQFILNILILCDFSLMFFLVCGIVQNVCMCIC